MGGCLVRGSVCDEHPDLLSLATLRPCLFLVKVGCTADITLQEIFGSVLPFIGMQIIGMLLVMFIPDIALWLPKSAELMV